MPAAATSCSMWARRSRKVVVRDASWPTRGRAIHRRDRRRGRVSSGRVRERTVRPADVRRRRTSRRVTDTGTGVSFRRLHQQRAAMGAQIGQCRQFAGGAAQDDDRLPAEVGGEEVAGRGRLVGGVDEHPLVAPDVCAVAMGCSIAELDADYRAFTERWSAVAGRELSVGDAVRVGFTASFSSRRSCAGICCCRPSLRCERRPPLPAARIDRCSKRSIGTR